MSNPQLSPWGIHLLSISLGRFWIRRPVAIAGYNSCTLVQGPEGLTEKVVVQVEFAVDDRPPRRIDVRNAVDRYRIRTVTSILRKVLLRVSLEPLQVFLRSKSICWAFPDIAVLL